MGISKISHGGKRYINDTVYVVVALLHLRAQDTNDFEAESIDANPLPQSVTSRKEFFFGLGTEHGDPSTLEVILERVKAALCCLQNPDRSDIGMVADGSEIKGSRVVLDVCTLVHLRRDAGDLGDVLCQQVDIVRSKAQRRTGLLATSLH